MVETLNKYLPSLEVEYEALKVKNLPPLYKKIYEFNGIKINGKTFLTIEVKDNSLGPREFKKHSNVIKRVIENKQIWYLKELHFNKVQRMIENEFNFIIKDKQIHLPCVNTSIIPESKKVELKKSLTGLSVNILIREILSGDLENKNKTTIASLFNTTRMSAGRGLEPLIKNELCEEVKVGTAKLIKFKSRSELWLYIRKNVKTPVKEIIFIDEQPQSLPLSGMSALSMKSMLVDNKIKTFSSEKKAFKREFIKTDPVFEEFAASKIELWDREPVLVEDGCINVIDTYLTSKDEEDERVQIELEKLLEENNLEIG